jgi:hypothetical protein
MTANQEEQNRIEGCLAGRTDLNAMSECNALHMVGDPTPPNEPVPISPYLWAAILPLILGLGGWLAFGWIKQGFARDANPPSP